VLADWIDPGSIEATLREGVLQLKLLKKPEAQRQRIPIRDAGNSDLKRIENQSP
jgi:HSP20 family molecular chaperone IbpA